METGLIGDLRKKLTPEKILFPMAFCLAALALVLWQIYQPSAANNTKDLSRASLVIILYLAAIFTIAYRAVTTASARGIGEQGEFAHTAYFGMILGLGLILRMTFSTTFTGFPNDMDAFKAWATLAGQNLPGFYTSGVWVDYVPGYIYVLALLGKIAALTGVDVAANAAGYTALIKIPSMITDLLAAYFIYKVASSKDGFHGDKRMQLFVMALIVFNPVIFLVSAIWGQVDIILTLVACIALFHLMKKRYLVSTIWFAVAILIKPQAIFFFPVLLLALIRDAVEVRGNILMILKCFGTGLGVFIAGILPFSFGQPPYWIILKYLTSMGGYTGATVNAFNLYAIFGLNWVDDSKTFLLIPYFAWGMIFTIGILALVAWLYARDKGNPAMPFIASLIMITGVFNLSSRMHERYEYPALMLVLLIYIILKDRKFLYLFGLLTVAQFINYIYVFICYQPKEGPLGIGSPAVTIASLTSLVIFACVVTVCRSAVLDWNPPALSSPDGSRPVSAASVKKNGRGNGK
jgi:Gpi18-like mannosyltransferase